MNELIPINYNSDRPTVSALCNWEMFDEKSDIPKDKFRFLGAGNVYAVEVGDTLKIGSTRDIRGRIFTHANQAQRSGKPVGKVIVSACHDNFRKSERTIQKMFGSRRIGKTEFFKMALSDFVEHISEIDAAIDFEDKPDGEPFSVAWNRLINDGHTSVSKTPKITGKGQAYFVNQFLGVAGEEAVQ